MRLTSLAEMVQWAQNWARSRSIWSLGYGLACCAIELIAAAAAPQYDLSRFGSEVFRSSSRQVDLMVVAGTVSIKMGPRLRLLWEQMPEPKWVLSMGQCANSGGEFYDSYYTVQGVDTIVPVDVYVPGCPRRPVPTITAGPLTTTTPPPSVPRAGILAFHGWVKRCQSSPVPCERVRAIRSLPAICRVFREIPLTDV